MSLCPALTERRRQVKLFFVHIKQNEAMSVETMIIERMSTCSLRSVFIVDRPIPDCLRFPRPLACQSNQKTSRDASNQPTQETFDFYRSTRDS